MNRYSTKNRFLSDLKEYQTSLIVSKWLIDRTPHIFSGQRLWYLEWKEILSEKLEIDSHAMSIMGSASIGFSLNPNKNFKYFDDTSDVDIAIISNYYFELSWHYLRNLGSKVYALDQTKKASIKDHVSRLIYWGTIATDKILSILPFGKKWLKTISEMSSIQPTINHKINLRLYKDFESLRAYHINNLNKLREKLFTPV